MTKPAEKEKGRKGFVTREIRGREGLRASGGCIKKKKKH